MACEENHLNVVKLLIERGTGKEVKGRFNQTPLHLACKKGHLDVVQLMIEQGADEEAKHILSGQTPLHFACKGGNLNVVKLLIERGADKEAKEKSDQTPLHFACKAGHIDIVQLLIDQGANVEAKDNTSQTPLQTTCSRGYFYVVNLLIEYGADLNAKNNENQTPLHLACEGGHLEVVKLLIERGADKEAKDKYHQTPLHLACAGGHLDVVKLLIYQGADKEANDKSFKTPLHLACEGGHLDVVKLLIDQGADKEAKDKSHLTPLLFACAGGHFGVVQLLIERRSDKEPKDGFNRTLLHFASARGHLDMVKLLIEQGADREAKDHEYRTPLHFACKGGHLEVVKLLIEQVKDKETKDKGGLTPLHWACKGGHLEVVKLLIQLGADKEAKDDSDRTSIHYACEEGNLEVFKWLVHRGANLKAKDRFGRMPIHLVCRGGNVDAVRLLVEQNRLYLGEKDGLFNHTPLYLACEKGSFEMVKLLIEKGANPNEKDRNVRTLLHLACDKGYVEVAKLLIDNGAQLNEKDDHGRTPIHLACLNAHVEIVNLLFEKGANLLERDSLENTALHLTVYPLSSANRYREKKDVVNMLLRFPPQSLAKLVNAPNQKNETAIQIAFENGYIDMVQSLFLAAQGNVPRQLFSFSNMKIDSFVKEFNITELEEFMNKLTLADERRRLYESALENIFFKSGSENQRKKELQQSSKAVANTESPSDNLDDSALRLFIAIMSLDYKKIEQLVRTNRENKLLQVKDLKGNTFIHLVANLFSRQNIPNIDCSSPLLEDICHDLKRVYPEEGSHFLSLVAVALFLIDNGCDWTATNKKGRTAADEVSFRFDRSTVTEIFKEECDRHHLMALMLNMSKDSHRRMPSTVFEGIQSIQNVTISDSPIGLSIDLGDETNHTSQITTAGENIQILNPNKSEDLVCVPFKRRRMTNKSEEEDSIQISNNWCFDFGRKVSAYGTKNIHLKDPLGGSYTRNGKETSWRCSSKSKCSAVVRRVKGETNYKFYNNHSCKTKSHGPTDVIAIPISIQEHLGDSPENLEEFIKRSSGIQ